MEPEVTYTEMTAALGDGITEEAFAECLPHAVAAVREVTWPNAPATEGQRAAWKRAVMAALLADARGGSTHGAGTGGFSIGSYSVSGGTAAAEARGAVRDAVVRELAGSGLLYMGLGEL